MSIAGAIPPDAFASDVSGAEADAILPWRVNMNFDVFFRTGRDARSWQLGYGTDPVCGVIRERQTVQVYDTSTPPGFGNNADFPSGFRERLLAAEPVSHVVFRLWRTGDPHYWECGVTLRHGQVVSEEVMRQNILYLYSTSECMRHVAPVAERAARYSFETGLSM